MSPWLWWFIGAGSGVLLLLPIVRLLLRRVERRARDAERRARDAERLAELGSMTSGLAHEIKNPLSTIGLNAQLLSEAISDANLPQEQRDKLLRRIEALSREADRLGGILTDFLQFAGRVRLDREEADLCRIVDELSDFYHPQCQQAKITLRTQLSDCPVYARVDESLLKQAVLNLMINATQVMSAAAQQAAAEGEAPRDTAMPNELILRVEADDDRARIHVTDTGPGIEPERIPEIFRPYVSLKRGGTGLGLPTAKRIVDEHGGQLTVHSTLGKGSDFVIELPLREEDSS